MVIVLSVTFIPMSYVIIAFSTIHRVIITATSTKTIIEYPISFKIIEFPIYTNIGLNSIIATIIGNTLSVEFLWLSTYF